MNAKSVTTRDYEGERRFAARPKESQFKAKQTQTPAFGRKHETLSNYLKTVSLSKTKGLGVANERFFAALRMTRCLLETISKRKMLNKTNGCQMTVPKGYLTGHDLKKQSQFAPARISAKSFVEGDYENRSRRGLRENKANSKPISRQAYSLDSSGRRLGVAR
jgi:hypothetical protein